MKYNLQAKVYGIVFSSMLKKYYKKHFPDMEIKKIIKDVKKEYKAMVKRTPGINGSILEPNLTGACYFFAMGKKVPNMTPELLDEIVLDGFSSDFMVKHHAKARKKGTLFSEKSQDKYYKDSLRSQKSNLEMDWKYTVEKGIDEFSYTYTRCGCCRLAERENMKEYLPCLCHMDFPKFKLSGGKLIRTKTLANGDECCNFHVVRIKEEEK